MENTITLPISKRDIRVKTLMSTKEVREARTELNKLISVVNQIEGKEPTPEQITIISNKTQRQDEIVAEVLLKRLEVTQDELDEMPYAEGLFAYSKLLELSQTIPKN